MNSFADGRRYARVWDASQYPSLFTYVDGRLEVSEQMPYRPREPFNKDMTVFHALAVAGATPYTSMGDRRWERLVRASGTLEAVEEDIEKLLNKIPPGWEVSELLPEVPRQTVGFRSDTDHTAVDDPSAPFPSVKELKFPWNESLPPN